LPSSKLQLQVLVGVTKPRGLTDAGVIGLLGIAADF
jgi:hypothetical protein